MADTFGAVADAIDDLFQGNAALVAALGGSTGLDAYRMWFKRAPERVRSLKTRAVFPYVVFFITDAAKEDTLSEEGEILNVQFNIYDYDKDSPDDDRTLNNIYSLLDDLFDKSTLVMAHYNHIYMIRNTMIVVPTTDDTQQMIVFYEVMVQHSSSSSSTSSSSTSSSSSSTSSSSTSSSSSSGA